jgi:glycosyltransferase involved in cell wall biosynthesis
MLTFAFCTFNRGNRLRKLVATMRDQEYAGPFEILAVNNNSTDDTAEVLQQLAADPGPPLRWVTESEQGIVSARNRAIHESLDSEIMVFIDDDELPLSGLLEAAAQAIKEEGAKCAGGKVELDFSNHPRPEWLGDESLGFLAAIDYGDEPFWITDRTTPIWTANVAYDMRIFREDSGLRFDKRYDRKGNVVGGGSDAIMFRALLDRQIPIRYAPGMAVLHDVEPWRLKRRYFLKLHFRSGLRRGEFQLPEYDTKVLGIPPFMINQFIGHSAKALWLQLTSAPLALRTGMNAAHSLGAMVGYRRRRSANSNG